MITLHALLHSKKKIEKNIPTSLPTCKILGRSTANKQLFNNGLGYHKYPKGLLTLFYTPTYLLIHCTCYSALIAGLYI